MGQSPAEQADINKKFRTIHARFKAQMKILVRLLHNFCMAKRAIETTLKKI